MAFDFPHVFEEHSSTLPIWWQHRYAPKPAVYLDAHLDLQKVEQFKIDALKKCTRIEQVNDLESPHHLNLSSKYAFGIENFLFAASELDLISRLIWVSPPHIPRTYSSALLEFIQQIDGITFEELTSFVKVGKSALRGKLMGLDITICHYDDIQSLDIGVDYYLDIDIDYFIEVPGDKIWIDPLLVLQRIISQLGTPNLTTISRATGSGFTPIQFRFIADYLSAGISGDSNSLYYYQQLYAAANLTDKGNHEAAKLICNKLVQENPECPHAFYFLHFLSFEQTGNSSHLEQAIDLEPCYAFDLSREASSYPNRKKDIDKNLLRYWLNQNNPNNQDKNKQNAGNLSKEKIIDVAAYGEIALGILLANSGDLKSAWQLLQNQTGELENHSDLMMAIAQNLIAGKQPQLARPLLEIASNHHKSRTAATLFLGDLAFRAGDATKALAFYKQAQQSALAWQLPLQRMHMCYEIMGQQNHSDITMEKLNVREAIMTQLIEQYT